MKEYQSLIGKIILGRCDHYSGLHRRQCNRAAGGSIGSQIASAIFNA